MSARMARAGGSRQSTWAPTASTVGAPSSTVELSVSCRNLPKMDTFSESDPMCVLFIKRFGTEEWREVGRTEMVSNNPNPDFVHKFIMDYFFEESQKLKFQVYDVDSSSMSLSKHDYMGQVHCTLGEIVSQRRLEKPLEGIKKKKKTKKKPSRLIVEAEELHTCKNTLSLQLCGHNLDKKDTFGKSDPYLRFSRRSSDGSSYTVVHETEVIKNTLNPTWRPFKIAVRALCNGDYDRPLLVESFDWDSDGRHDFIGAFTTSARQLSEQRKQRVAFELINPKKQRKHSYRNSGTIELLSAKIEEKYTFLDYLKGGTEVHCIIAVDFTSSNGNPRDPGSLHYIGSSSPNMYIRALKAVGEILQDYDSDKLFPALGFGATVPPDVNISDNFYLNGDDANPYCEGIDGVMQAYLRTAQIVKPYPYANFAGVINCAASTARPCAAGNDYFILVILTDGTMKDPTETIEAIIQASNLPLSIVIIGIGNADFKVMNILDGDTVRLSSGGRMAERDIVQFVPFRDFLDRGQVSSEALLARAVLAEIPDQFLSFMKSARIRPKPPAPLAQPSVDYGDSSEDEFDSYDTAGAPERPDTFAYSDPGELHTMPRERFPQRDSQYGAKHH